MFKVKYDPQHTPRPDGFDFNLKPNGQPKSKRITLKPGTPQQSKVKGYVYNFELTAPTEIHRLILAAGIGEKNSTGFGWVERTNPTAT